MLIWMAAMHCEAKPVIDFYRLKKSPDHQVFDLYQSDEMICIISGIGKVAMAAACAWVAALKREQNSLAWLNIGIAGAAQDKIGTAVWINKISDSESDRSFYPVPLIRTSMAAATCLTLNEPSYDYQSGLVFDMEASSFFTTATRFSSAELVQSIKIVSDNLAHQTGRDKLRVSELIDQNMLSVNQFALSLQALNKQTEENKIDASDWRHMLEKTHFSQTQKYQLRKSLNFLLSQDYDIGQLTDEISGCHSSKSIIAHLRQLCLLSSRTL